MNFIASTLISVLDDEEMAFWIFMSLLINKEMKTLFLPVIIFLYLYIFLGSTRASFKELLDGTADKVPHASFVCSLALNLDDN